MLEIVPDPEVADRFRAVIAPGSYLPFSPAVPRRVDGALVERDCPNAQWAVRPLSEADFARIVGLGLPDEELLPREGEDELAGDRVHDLQAPFEVERTIVQSLVSRPFRERAFRRAVLEAYDARCAVTGWKLLNGGGRDSSCLRLRRRRGPSGPLGYRAIRRDARSRLRAAGRSPDLRLSAG